MFAIHIHKFVQPDDSCGGDIEKSRSPSGVLFYFYLHRITHRLNQKRYAWNQSWEPVSHQFCLNFRRRPSFYEIILATGRDPEKKTLFRKR